MDKKLLKGVIDFKKEVEKNKKIFNELKNKQSPTTFFIGCSDSRIIPNLITQTFVGEVFVLRNIANIIPSFNENDSTLKCSASVLEYAVKYLEVKNIVVCGHSNCGGLKALFYKDEELDKFPFVKKWLELVKDLKEEVKDIKDVNLRALKVEQLNVIKQVENIMSYPFVKERVEQKKLEVLGWYYVIDSGDVYNYNFTKKEFELIN